MMRHMAIVNIRASSITGGRRMILLVTHIDELVAVYDVVPKFQLCKKNVKREKWTLKNQHGWHWAIYESYNKRKTRFANGIETLPAKWEDAVKILRRDEAMFLCKN